jgi:arylsulfatase A-like enzyme
MVTSRDNPVRGGVERHRRPNVVLILLDDTGFGQLGSYGSDVATPHLDRIANEGLLYNRFHVTALCSPTRASLLTGRNHHAVGVGFLVDIPMASPGYSARLPRSSAALPRILRDAGYNTMAVGKWHLVPRGERSPAGPYDRWPLGFGFERYYGFLQGDANHWTPNLVSDNHYIEPPTRPHEGYHLTEDLADQAINMVVAQKNSAKDKPFFLYWALGATHAPHHVPPEWVVPYEGRFDDGWERSRERIFQRQKEKGVVPGDTVLTERPPWIDAWDDLPTATRRMHARGQEVFAGFLSHTDAQVGRFLTFLEHIGELDNTLVMVLSDNGASAEGGRLGTFNEHRFSARLPESVEDNLAESAHWGGFRSYNHYSWGWAWAGNTPFKLWKRYTWLGGTRAPLLIRWPEAFAAHGEVRSQFCHAVDLTPTLLDSCGIPQPETVDGIPQDPFDGKSLLPSFDDASAPDPRSTQYFEMLGSRSIMHEGWRATTDHVSQGVVDEEELMIGSRTFATDHWSLYGPDDFSESHDVSELHPERVRELEQLWSVEAERNNVLPLSDNLGSRLHLMLPAEYPPGPRRVFFPGVPVTDEAVPFLGGGFSIEVDVQIPPKRPDGILCAFGDWNGGFALYVMESRLTFAFRPAGDLAMTVAHDELRSGDHILSVACLPQADGVDFALTCDGETVGRSTAHVAMPVAFQHGGTHLRIGFDNEFPIVEAYEPPFRWAGVIHHLTVEGSAPTLAFEAEQLADGLRAE